MVHYSDLILEDHAARIISIIEIKNSYTFKPGMCDNQKSLLEILETYFKEKQFIINGLLLYQGKEFISVTPDISAQNFLNYLLSS